MNERSESSWGESKFAGLSYVLVSTIVYKKISTWGDELRGVNRSSHMLRIIFAMVTLFAHCYFAYRTKFILLCKEKRQTNENKKKYHR